MKNKKIIMYAIIILIIIFLMHLGYYIFNNVKNENNKKLADYIPEEEITEEQLRKTMILLYFPSKENNKLIPETRQIDAKELIKYPYEYLIRLLIEGPENENLMKIIPEKTKLINSEIKQDILFLNFSKDLIEVQLGKEKEEIIIKSIINTVTELTEINKVAILIEGEEDRGFLDGELNFDRIFIKE